MDNTQTPSNLKRNYYSHQDAGRAFSWAVVAPYIVSLVALLIGMSILGKEVVDNLGFIIASAIITPLSFLAVFFIYNKTQKISFKACNLKFNLGWKTILVLIAISVICIFGLQYLIYGVNIGLDKLGYKFSSLDIPLTNGWWYVLNLFVVAFLPAVCEELIFRGIIFNGLRRNMKDGFAMLLSAALFALMHGSLEQLLYPFILGIILSWVVLRTGSLFSSIIVHFANNAIVITLSFVENMTSFSFVPSTPWLFWVLAFVLAALTFGLLFIIDKFYFRRKVKVENLEKSSDDGKVPSIAMIIGIVVAAILFIVSTVGSFSN